MSAPIHAAPFGTREDLGRGIAVSRTWICTTRLCASSAQVSSSRQLLDFAQLAVRKMQNTSHAAISSFRRRCQSSPASMPS